MNDGWIKLNRRVVQNEIFLYDDKAWKVFMFMLCRADHKTGVFRTGLLVFSESLSMPKTTLHNAIDRLIKAGMVYREPNTNYTDYYICNFSKYQHSDRTQTETKPKPNRTQTDTIQEDKNKRIYLDKSKYNSDSKKQIVIDEGVGRLYYQYLKNNQITVTNHKVLRQKINEHQRTVGKDMFVSYLEFMLEKFNEIDGKYKPSITGYLDLISKYPKVVNFVKNKNEATEVF